MDYCECGTIKELGVCMNRRCTANPDIKSRTWIIDGAEVRFERELTLEEALIHGQVMSQKLIKQANSRPPDIDVHDVFAKRAHRLGKVTTKA